MDNFMQAIDQLFEDYNLFLKSKISSKSDITKLYQDFKQKNNLTLENEKKKKKKTAYQNFFTIVRKELASSLTNVPFGEVSKIISQRWKTLSKEEKKKYNDCSNEEIDTEVSETSKLEDFFINENNSESETEDTEEFYLQSEHEDKPEEEYHTTEENEGLLHEDEDEEEDDDSVEFDFEED